jgi:AAA15 family ATPase/GTPase
VGGVIMLCQFSVKNYKCFRDEFTLDLQATSITENENKLIVYEDGEKFLPLAVIYGPNGGGKSTVLSALYSLHTKIMRPICSVRCDNKSCANRSFCSENSINIPIEPFAFSKKSKNSPTEYELFFRTESAEYQYLIMLYNGRVIYEELYRKKILGSRYSMVFHRKGHSIKLKGSMKDYNVSELSDSLPLLSFLIITHARNAVLKDIYQWFDSQIDFRNYGEPFSEAKIAIINNGRKSLLLDMLKEMDIGIAGYRVDEETDKQINIYTIHDVGGIKTELDFDDESSGTIKVFGLLPYILNSIITGSTLIIDELDAKLHPSLIKYIITLYNDKKINKKGAQLIFTSHDLTTMTNEFFRRDEIWFVAKTDDEAAKLYSLAAFARKDAKYDKQYLEGRYGADPYLQRIINWESLHNESEEKG